MNARILFVMGGALLLSSPAWSRCVTDQKHSLEEMAASPKPWSSMVPRGFKIDPHKVAYAVSTLVGPIPTYTLPTDAPGQGRTLAYIGSDWATYREIAECRVEAPDGRWWLAVRNAGGDLTYVLQSQTEANHKR